MASSCSAVIPIFQFPKWRYTNLYEVLLYADTFNLDFETEGRGRNILGMVGTGYMNNKMILSQKALRHGFENDSDKKNTAIHEFVHLIDKMDGTIDGIPQLLLERPYVLPWLELMKEKIDEIQARKSDINPYGSTNHAEFFAVASEYFFERPQLLAQRHPELYAILEEIFDQDIDERNLQKMRLDIGRNSPCPCGSGQKFKRCCGRSHYSKLN
ncbi:MAG: zinc-dependent peptidase [Bacteroidota bacterium]